MYRNPKWAKVSYPYGAEFRGSKLLECGKMSGLSWDFDHRRYPPNIFS
ncbi:hypothetical protein PSFL111601_09855 [Pseudomonas floridensis]